MKRINVVLGVILVVCLVAACFYSERKSAAIVRPPPGATNLVAFLELQSQPYEICKFVYSGKTHLEVIGKPVILLFSPPSGPPAYIFDENGRIVDWCRDIGDNPSFIKKWGDFSNAVPITRDEAKQLVTSSKVNTALQKGPQ